MFYSQLILAKKGPLGTIWIAAHLERKLRKNQVTETNISVSVDSILFPEAPIALRLSGHLLLGVVRIYSRKVNYLFHDCSEALTKIKQAFHSGVVDLPPESATAPFHAITLPENFDLDELEPLPDRESEMLLATGAADHHVTTRELITLQDPMEDNIYFGSQFGLDERFPEADMPRMALDFEEFKSLLLSNMRNEEIRLDRHSLFLREFDLMENLAEIDEGGCDDLDFPEPEEMEREKEAREREQSPKLTLEEEVPPPVDEERIDFDRMDQMDAMDMDTMPPMTPAPPSMMDLDEEIRDRPVEQPEEFEQLAPVVEEEEQLALMVEERVPLEPVIDEPEQVEQAPVTEAPEPLITETIAEAPEEFVPHVEMEEQVEAAAAAQEPGDEVALVEVPDELVPAIEAAAEKSKPSSPVRPEVEQEEVPEVETLRSAVEPPTDQGPDFFAFEKEAAMASENVEARDGDQQMPDQEQLVEDDDRIEELQEVSGVNIPGLTSPRRRPSLMDDDLPADDDVLATLLGGRSTPALRVVATPSEEAPTKRVKRAPKPPPRKRKPILDIAMVLHGDVMREQLANTDDIRRVRKKAPCTQHELWDVQRQFLGYQVFSEPSLPGVCNALRELYDRMLVTGETDLPLAQEVTPESTPEKAPPTPEAEAPLEEPVTEEKRTPDAQPEVREVEEPAAELVVEPAVEMPADVLPTPETGAAVPTTVPTEAGTPLQPEREPKEAQDLNLVSEEQAADDVNKEVATPQVEDVEGVAVQPSVALEEEITNKDEVAFPVLGTDPEVASEPLPLPSPAATMEHILLSESETPTDQGAREEAGMDMQTEIPGEPNVEGVVGEVVLMEEELQVTEPEVPARGEEEVPIVVAQPELLEQVAAEAEAVAEAVVEGDAVVVNEDGTTVIVLEDDGAVIVGPFPVIEVKEEVVEEETHQAELSFLGEPRETVFLDQDDDDLHEEAESYDDSTKDATLQGLGGWSARTRAVGGYLQGVFENLNADTRRDKDEAPKIGLDHILRGKSRKEAARMFFETLVLKTKDYIDVEQEQPYGELYLSARPKLMKASF